MTKDLKQEKAGQFVRTPYEFQTWTVKLVISVRSDENANQHWVGL